MSHRGTPRSGPGGRLACWYVLLAWLLAPQALPAQRLADARALSSLRGAGIARDSLRPLAVGAVDAGRGRPAAVWPVAARDSTRSTRGWYVLAGAAVGGTVAGFVAANHARHCEDCFFLDAAITLEVSAGVLLGALAGLLVHAATH